MKLVNFNFKKISIEKISDSLENMKINSKINISEIKPLDSKFSNEKDTLITIVFSYGLQYTPNIANLEFEGKITLLEEKTKAKEILEKWKEKKMSDDFRVTLFNLILRKANVKALELEEEMRLPLHIPLPSIKIQKE